MSQCACLEEVHLPNIKPGEGLVRILTTLVYFQITSSFIKVGVYVCVFFKIPYCFH